MSEYEGYDCYQFISLNGTRSAFEDSDLKNPKCRDYIVPQGKQIRTVKTMLDRRDGWLRGFKWIGDDGAVLFAFSNIDDDYYRNSP